MKLSETQNELLKRIESKMQRGDIAAIAEITGMTREYVGMVLNPDSDFYNETIVIEAVKLVTEREQKTKQLLESITA